MNATTDELLYEFEKNDDKKIKKTKEDIDRATKVFISKIKFDPAVVNSLDDDLKDSIQDYVKEFPLNILWYQDKIKKERNNKRWAFILGLVLLATLPFAIYFVSTRDSFYNSSSSIITIFLTVILAFYKTVTSWIENRKFQGIFWKASSELKSKLFQLEDEWEGKVINQEKLKEFKERLDLEIIEARKIVDAEKDEYFKNYSFPKVELSSVLTSSKTEIQQLVKDFQSPHYQKLATEEKRKLTAETIRKEIKSFEKSIELEQERIKQLETDLLGDVDKVLEATLKKEIVSINQRISKMHHSMVLKKAELVAYE